MEQEIVQEEESTIYKKVIEKLEQNKIEFSQKEHPPCITSEDSAFYRNDSLASGAKVSLLKSQDKTTKQTLFVVSVISAAEEIKWNSFKKILNTKNIQLAEQQDVEQLTYGLFKGALPPFGSLYSQQLQTYVDQSLIDQGEHINFNCGMRTRSIRMSVKDYLQIEQPIVCNFNKKG